MNSRTVFFVCLLLAATGLISPSVALAGGIAFGFAFEHPFRLESHELAKFLLQASVVALGFGMNLKQVVHAGRSGFLYTAISISCAMLLGLLFGSLLNVCIVRLPLHESIVKPRSHCSQCGALIYVSLAEHYVRIVPAEEAARLVAHEQWQAAVNEALAPLAAGATEAALTGLAQRCGDLLAGPFPPGASPDLSKRQRFHIV